MTSAAPAEHGDQWIDNRARKTQDEAFQDALLLAWREGKENPPMVGVDTRPCTCNPRFVPLRYKEPPHHSNGDVV